MAKTMMVISIVSGVLSAGFWLAAAIVPSMPEWIRKNRPEDATPGNFNFDLILGLTEAFRKSSNLNKYAAVATGISILANAAANAATL